MKPMTTTMTSLWHAIMIMLSQYNVNSNTFMKSFIQRSPISAYRNLPVFFILKNDELKHFFWVDKSTLNNHLSSISIFYCMPQHCIVSSWLFCLYIHQKLHWLNKPFLFSVNIVSHSRRKNDSFVKHLYTWPVSLCGISCSPVSFYLLKKKEKKK